MKLKITTLILLFITGSLFAQGSEEAISLKTKTGEIKGTLLCPTANKKTPVVLIIAGSGSTDRNGNNPIMTNNSLKMLAESLYKHGIASLRYDKRGIGESQNAGLKEQDLRFGNYVEDAQNWAALLKKDRRFSEVIIIGHSEGSLIGMIAAQQNNTDSFISIAGGGTTAAEILKEQLKTQPQFVLDESIVIIEKLEKGETVENVPQFLYSLFRPSVQPYLISWFKYNPQKEIAQLNKPVLIIQGSTDLQVGIADAEKLSVANTGAEKIIIEGMNHILKEVTIDRTKNMQTYSIPDLPIKKELVSILVKFIND